MADNQNRRAGYNLQLFAAQQLKEIFSTVTEEYELKTPLGRRTRIDLFAQSKSGQIVLFEVKHIHEGMLSYSEFLQAIALRDSVSNMLADPNFPPVVVLLTNGKVGASVAAASEKARLPIVTLGDQTSETAQRLNLEFQRIGILLPELMEKYGGPSLEAYSAALLGDIDRIWRRAGNYAPSWRQISVLPQSQLEIPTQVYRELFPGAEIPLEEIAHGFPLLGLDLASGIYKLGPQGWIGIVPIEAERPPSFLWLLRQDGHFAYREVLWEESSLSITGGHTHIGSLLQLALATTFFMRNLISRAHLPLAIQCSLQLDLHGMKNRTIVGHPIGLPSTALLIDGNTKKSQIDTIIGTVTTNLESIVKNPLLVGYRLVASTVQSLRPDLTDSAALERQLRIRLEQDRHQRYRFLGFLDKELEASRP